MGQEPYLRESCTVCSPVVVSLRMCFPRACSTPPHLAQRAGCSAARLPTSTAALAIALPSTNPARHRAIRFSTSSSISCNVAVGCSSLSQHFLRQLMAALLILCFHLSLLSLTDPAFRPILPCSFPLCKNLTRTRACHPCAAQENNAY